MMRMLLKVVLPTAAYNRAAAAGLIGKVWSKVFGICPPEATYYLNEDGMRSVYAVFDMKSPDQIVALSLPLYEHFEADVTFVPVMSFEDLQKALSAT
jgi:hypothetical protein